MARKTKKKTKQIVGRRPTAGKTKRKKQTMGLAVCETHRQRVPTARRRDPTARSGKVRLPRPTSFFFLLSLSFFLVENQVLLGIDFFCAFFSL
jgi:hypothetical protein